MLGIAAEITFAFCRQTMSLQVKFSVLISSAQHQCSVPAPVLIASLQKCNNEIVVLFSWSFE